MNDDDEKPHNKPRTWLERLSALVAREPQDREQLMEVLRDAEDKDIVSSEMLGMIERIVQVSEMQVREVMVPKAQMVVLQSNMSLDVILPKVIESGHSRYPVLDEEEKDVIGILLAKDLLKFYFTKEKDSFNIDDIIRPAIYIPQSKRLDVLLREFRVNRNHLAIVLDEYGHAAGLVTIEDVLEQIVGEIEDEYDLAEDDIHIKKLDDGSYIVKASTLVTEFNDYFSADFNETECDNIGEFVSNHFGYLPKRGESIKLGHFRFKVLNGDNRQIYLLEVRVIKSRKKEDVFIQDAI